MRRSAIIALAAVERVGGWFWLPLNLMMSVLGLLNILRNWRLHSLALPIVCLSGLAFFSGAWGNPDPARSMIRAGQLLAMAGFFSWLITYMRPAFLQRACLWVVPILTGSFLIELSVKSDLRAALLKFDLGYFWNSGGASFENSGVMLIAGGNVYAAALAGSIALIAWQSGHRWLGALSFGLSLLTGSRALFLAYIVLALYALFIMGRAWARRGVLIVIVGILAAQPFIFLSYALFPDYIQAWLNDLSPRYVAWTAYARMGLEHPFGVGYFQGKEFGQYFWDRWPIQAHNITLGIWGEVGPLGYGCWIWFLWRLAAWVQFSDRAVILFAFTLMMYTFIGGLNEWSFWVPLALAVHSGAQVRTKLSKSTARLGDV